MVHHIVMLYSARMLPGAEQRPRAEEYYAFWTMEKMDGSLCDVPHDVSPALMRRILSLTCDSLSKFHGLPDQERAHYDFKPRNCLYKGELSSDNPNLLTHVKLTDLTASRKKESDDDMGAFCTLHFASFEQLVYHALLKEHAALSSGIQNPRTCIAMVSVFQLWRGFNPMAMPLVQDPVRFLRRYIRLSQMKPDDLNVIDRLQESGVSEEERQARVYVRDTYVRPIVEDVVTAE